MSEHAASCHQVEFKEPHKVLHYFAYYQAAFSASLIECRPAFGIGCYILGVTVIDLCQMTPREEVGVIGTPLDAGEQALCMCVIKNEH